MELNPQTGKLILLGEVDLDDQELFAEVLFKLDNSFKLESFVNGEKLLHYLHSLPDHELPGLILMDYNLPKKSGAEVIIEINQHPRYILIPKFIWSTSNSFFFKETSIRSGAVEYITKPINYDNLFTIVKHVLSFTRMNTD
jgi:CheY-like chemotaxis protein